MERPRSIEFADATSPVEWASAVAAGFAWLVESLDASLRECWLTPYLAMMTTYRLRSTELGVRVTALDIDPTVGQPLDPRRRGLSGTSSLGMAGNLFHGVPMDGYVPSTPWRDDTGRGWWDWWSDNGVAPDRTLAADVSGPRAVVIA